MTGSDEWAGSFQRAKAMVDQMTLEEKVKEKSHFDFVLQHIADTLSYKVIVTGGVQVDNGCSGNIAAIPRLKFHGMCLTDAGNSVRATDAVSGFTSGISVGARYVYQGRR